MNFLSILAESKLIDPPKYVYENLCLLVKTGSVVYGCNTNTSDNDLAGVCIPHKSILFPYKEEYIYGFGTPPVNFESYSKHHVIYDNQDYDITVYSIIKFFELCRRGNPNLIDILFTPERFVVHETRAGRLIRDNKHLFLSGKIIDKYLSYCGNQIADLRSYKVKGNRKEIVEKYGFDTKDAANTIRGALSLIEILTTGDYNPSSNGPFLMDIRNGVWNYEQVCDKFQDLKAEIKELRNKNIEDPRIPLETNENLIKRLLVKCLEIQYGDLHIREESKAEEKLQKIYKILQEG